jgi:hypothetical protein
MPLKAFEVLSRSGLAASQGVESLGTVFHDDTKEPESALE